MRHNAGIDNYDNYIAVAALNVAVDIGEATDAYAALIGDPALRARMAEQGRKRARETFEWRRIYGQYRELWGELAQRRQHGTQKTMRKPGLSANPIHPDPFRLFAHYPTTTFNAKSRIKLVAGLDAAAVEVDAGESAAQRPPIRPCRSPDEMLAVRDGARGGGRHDGGRRPASGRAAAEARNLRARARAAAEGGADRDRRSVEVPNRAGPLV